MLTQIVPAPWRWAILVTLFALAGGFGWLEGARHVQARWDAAQARQSSAVAKQAARAAIITAAQTHVTEEVAKNVETRIAAVRSYYAGRVRQQPAGRSGAVPATADAAGSALADPANDGPPAAGSGLRSESAATLAERCAVTTEMVLGWQEWWGRVEQITPPE